MAQGRETDGPQRGHDQPAIRGVNTRETRAGAAPDAQIRMERVSKKIGGPPGGLVAQVPAAAGRPPASWRVRTGDGSERNATSGNPGVARSASAAGILSIATTTRRQQLGSPMAASGLGAAGGMLSAAEGQQDSATNSPVIEQRSPEKLDAETANARTGAINSAPSQRRRRFPFTPSSLMGIAPLVKATS